MFARGEKRRRKRRRREGIVSSFMFLPFRIFHSTTPWNTIKILSFPLRGLVSFLISFVKDRKHLKSFFVFNLLASLGISFREIASLALPTWGWEGADRWGNGVPKICYHPSPPSSSSSLSFAFSSRSFALRTSRSCSTSRRSRALRSRRSQPPGSPRFSEVMEWGCWCWDGICCNCEDCRGGSWPIPDKEGSIGMSSACWRRVGFRMEDIELKRFVRPLSLGDEEGFSSWASEKLRFLDADGIKGLSVRWDSGDDGWRTDGSRIPGRERCAWCGWSIW